MPRLYFFCPELSLLIMSGRPVALLLLTLFLGLFATQAQQPDTTLELKPVRIQASRAGTSVIEPGRSLQVIDAAAIRQAPVRTVDELLEFALGMDARVRGPLGMQTDLSQRGGTFEQTLVLLNGIPLTDPQTGHHTLNLPVTLDQIERIEVLPGGASRVFGPKAFSGAVNIVTRVATGKGVSAGATGGEFGLWETNASARISTGAHRFAASVQRAGSDGYMPNTDFRALRSFAQAEGEHSKLSWQLFGGHNNKAFGAQNFYTSSFPDQFEATRTRFAGATLAYQGEKFSASLKPYYRRNHDRFELFREGAGWYQREGGFFILGTDTAPSWYTGHNYHRTDVWGTQFNSSCILGPHTLSLGADYRDERIRSNVLGEPLGSPEAVNGEPSFAQFTRGGDRQEINAYLEDQFQAGRWILTGGALLAHSTQFGTRLFPGLDVAYKASDRLRLFANANQSVRYPTYTDLYYNRGGAIGSKDLSPETCTQGELGARFVHAHVTAQAAVFVRQADDLIDWIRKNGETVTRAANITQATYYGGELNLNLHARDWWGEEWPFELVRLNYSYVNCDTASNSFESNYALDFLTHNLSVSLQQAVNSRLRVNWVLRYQDRRGGYLKPGATEESGYPAIVTLDARLSYRTKSIETFVDFNNLFNADYIDFGNIQQPGRWLRAGIAVSVGSRR